MVAPTVGHKGMVLQSHFDHWFVQGHIGYTYTLHGYTYTLPCIFGVTGWFYVRATGIELCVLGHHYLRDSFHFLFISLFPDYCFVFMGQELFLSEFCSLIFCYSQFVRDTLIYIVFIYLYAQSVHY
jgi:hypothetical protein